VARFDRGKHHEMSQSNQQHLALLRSLVGPTLSDDMLLVALSVAPSLSIAQSICMDAMRSQASLSLAAQLAAARGVGVLGGPVPGKPRLHQPRITDSLKKMGEAPQLGQQAKQLAPRPPVPVAPAGAAAGGGGSDDDDVVVIDDSDEDVAVTATSAAPSPLSSAAAALGNGAAAASASTSATPPRRLGSAASSAAAFASPSGAWPKQLKPMFFQTVCITKAPASNRVFSAPLVFWHEQTAGAAAAAASGAVAGKKGRGRPPTAASSGSSSKAAVAQAVASFASSKVATTFGSSGGTVDTVAADLAGSSDVNVRFGFATTDGSTPSALGKVTPGIARFLAPLLDAKLVDVTGNIAAAGHMSAFDVGHGGGSGSASGAGCALYIGMDLGVQLRVKLHRGAKRFMKYGPRPVARVQPAAGGAGNDDADSDSGIGGSSKDARGKPRRQDIVERVILSSPVDVRLRLAVFECLYYSQHGSSPPQPSNPSNSKPAATPAAAATAASSADKLTGSDSAAAGAAGASADDDAADNTEEVVSADDVQAILGGAGDRSSGKGAAGAAASPSSSAGGRVRSSIAAGTTGSAGAVEEQAPDLPQARQPASFRNLKLRPYQLQALAWMLHRETGEYPPEYVDPSQPQVAKAAASSLGGSSSAAAGSADANTNMTALAASSSALRGLASNMLWESHTLEDGSPLFLNPYTRDASLCAPPPARACKGGIIADQMGLGKTAELVSLVVAQMERARARKAARRAAAAGGGDAGDAAADDDADAAVPSVSPSMPPLVKRRASPASSPDTASAESSSDSDEDLPVAPAAKRFRRAVVAAGKSSSKATSDDASSTATSESSSDDGHASLDSSSSSEVNDNDSDDSDDGDFTRRSRGRGRGNGRGRGRGRSGRGGSRRASTDAPVFSTPAASGSRARREDAADDEGASSDSDGEDAALPRARTTLVVCPMSMIGQWAREIHKYTATFAGGSGGRAAAAGSAAAGSASLVAADADADGDDTGSTSKTPLSGKKRGRPPKASPGSGAKAALAPSAAAGRPGSSVASSTGLRVLVHYGPSRARDVRTVLQHDFVITSFGTLASEYDAFLKYRNAKAAEAAAAEGGDKAGGGGARSKSAASNVQQPVLFSVRFERVALDEAHTIRNR